MSPKVGSHLSRLESTRTTGLLGVRNFPETETGYSPEETTLVELGLTAGKFAKYGLQINTCTNKFMQHNLIQSGMRSCHWHRIYMHADKINILLAWGWV
jgi:hypothetical protein